MIIALAIKSGILHINFNKACFGAYFLQFQLFSFIELIYSVALQNESIIKYMYITYFLLKEQHRSSNK